jgi:hypothetical protein
MEINWVAVSRALDIPLPQGLSPEQQSEYIDRYLAEHDPEGDLRRFIEGLDPAKLDADCEEVLELWKKGDLIPVEDFLAELEKELPSEDEGAP